MIKTTKLQAVRYDKRCEVDGCDGYMLTTGKTVKELYVKFQHQCSVCGKLEWLKAQYPQVAYLMDVPKEEEAKYHPKKKEDDKGIITAAQ